MKRLLAMALFGVLCVTGLQAQYTSSQLQNIYMDMLSDEGIEGWIDSDGDVQFEHNSRTYFIGINANDPAFFRVVLFNIWPIESTNERFRALEAINQVNTDLKVAKAFINSDNVWISIELFVGNPNYVKDVFTRSLEVIESSVEKFVEAM